MTQAYEERFLFLLMLLRQPRLRMVYVTSLPIAPEIIEYYLALLPGVIPSHARSRLSLVAVNDASPRSLSEKLLERPHLLARIAALIPNRARSHLVPYNTTELERDVALSLGIPMYGADPRLAPLGSKTGCRRMFAEVGVPHPLGVENLRTLDDMADAVVGMRAERPAMDSAIVKLNEGVSGAGQRARAAGGSARARRPRTSGPPSWSGCGAWSWSRRRRRSTSTSPSSRRARGSSRSGSPARRSAAPASSCGSCRTAPSSCCRRTTSCSGARAGRATWAARSRRHRSTPGRSPSTPRRSGGGWPSQGALGRFAVDFVVVRGTNGEWTPYAIELNLRKGGTTHPFLTLQFLTDGRYDPATALFLTPRGHEKHLVATDHLESELLRGLAVVRPVRHRGPPRAPLRPVAAGRDRLPHDQLPHRARPDRPHGRRRHPGRGGPALPRGRADPAGGGAARPARKPRCRSEMADAADLVRRVRLQPGDGPVPLLPVRRAPGRRRRATTPAAETRANPPGPRASRCPAASCSPAESGVWGGGMAFYDRAAAGVVACRAYLVTTEQFADVAAQELRRPPGGEFAVDLAGLLPDVESMVTTGPGRYETVVRLGELDGVADVHDHPPRRREPAAGGADGAVPALDLDRSPRVTRVRRQPGSPATWSVRPGSAAPGPSPRSSRLPRPQALPPDGTVTPAG